MNDPRIIIEKGRLTGEPEIKQTKTGKTMLVSNLTCTSTLVFPKSPCCLLRSSSSRRSRLIRLPLPRRQRPVMTRGERSSEHGTGTEI